METLRKDILEAAVALYKNASEAVPIERVADLAGVHKMSIYRVFGSREGLERACAEALREQSRTVWVRNAEQSSTDPRIQLNALFQALAVRITENAHHGSPLRMLVTQSKSRDASDVLSAHRREVYSLILTLAKELTADEPATLAKALCLLWEGAVTPSLRIEERVELVLQLPSIVQRMIASHVD